MDKETVCMPRWFCESGFCCEIISAAWVCVFLIYFFLSLAFLTKCLSGFAGSITLNIIIHKTNKCFWINTEPLLLSLLEWQFFKENVTFMVTKKKKKENPYFNPGLSWHKLPKQNHKTKSIQIFRTGFSDKLGHHWEIIQYLLGTKSKGVRKMIHDKLQQSRQIICSWMGIHLHGWNIAHSYLQQGMHALGLSGDKWKVNKI